MYIVYKCCFDFHKSSVKYFYIRIISHRFTKFNYFPDALQNKEGQAIGLPLFIQIVPLTTNVAVPGVMAQVPSALCV